MAASLRQSVDEVERKSIRRLSPEFAKILVGARECLQGLEPPREIVGLEKAGQVRIELLMGVV